MGTGASTPRQYRSAEKCSRITRPAEVMRFHLKRFKWCGIRREKIHANVRVPLALDLSPYVVVDSNNSTVGGDGTPSAPTGMPDTGHRAGAVPDGGTGPRGAMCTSHTYQLVGVVAHEGKGIASGHYNAYCRADDGYALGTTRRYCCM